MTRPISKLLLLCACGVAGPLWGRADDARPSESRLAGPPAPSEQTAENGGAGIATPEKIAWAGIGAYRLLLRVEPLDTGERDSDELPARADVNWVALLRDAGVDGKADLRTLQVLRVDPSDGRPSLHEDYAYQRGPYDRAFRWYDSTIPDEFSEVLAPSSYTDGERVRRVNSRAGYMYNASGDWKSGRLAWTHTQTAGAASYYAVYFDLLDADATPPAAAPVGWLGDAMQRHDRWGKSTTGADSTHIAIDDWDGDGLFDIVHGEQYGQLFYLLNQGTAQVPEIGPSRMLFEADGAPMDVGVHAAPLVVDWDGDGVKDLLVGTYQNRIVFFRNTGTNQTRSFEFQGFLRDASGGFLALPVTPVAQKSEGAFKEDYFPVLEAVDWDGDGQQDLLCGGYITGRVYFYKNMGRRDGLPVLKFVGPLEADGEPINVRDWCAAPCVADFTGDGLVDLVVGAFTWHSAGAERPSFLRYFVNTGTATKPVLQERPLPLRGDARPFRLPNPRAVDTNGDGLLDLVVASGSDIFIFPNVGKRTEPLFDIDQPPIRAEWGNATVNAGHQVLDWNGDGHSDLVDGYTVYLNDGVGKPYFWSKSVPALPPGVRIDHPVALGDGHFYPRFHDLDHDGKLDVLFGDWHGHVWHHRNLTTDQEAKFDVEGVKLQTADGQAIKVGPIAVNPENDFQALQGARTTLTAGDFDGDGIDDLVVGDTYGKVRYYRNIGTLQSPRFAPAEVIADLKTRLHVETADWNRDGRLDVIISASHHKVYVLLNEGSAGEARFGECEPLDIAVKGPIAMVADLNGDGDDDLLINGTQGITFVERSFIEHGYAPAEIVRVESRVKTRN